MLGSGAYTNLVSGVGTGAITYSSGTPATATINASTGAVTLVAAGTTTITASKAATATHATATSTYTLTITAPTTFQILFDGNEATGGTVPNNPNRYDSGTSVVLPGSDDMVRSGYNFYGWNTQPNGLGNTYEPADIIIIGTADLALFALWLPAASAVPAFWDGFYALENTPATVALSIHDGRIFTRTTGSETQLFPAAAGYGYTSLYSSDICWSWDGAIPQRFARQTDGSILYRDPGHSIVRYVPCITSYYQVSYDLNGGSGDVPVDSYLHTSGETINVTNSSPSYLTKSGYRFTGWNSQANGKGTIYFLLGYSLNTTFAMPASDVVLYAYWTKLLTTGPAGGLIFYDKLEPSDGWQYLEAAPADLASTLPYYRSGFSNTAAVPTLTVDVGQGYTNTQSLVALMGSDTGYAAGACDAYSVNGYDDWFMPSRSELNYLWYNVWGKSLGGFNYSWYWSSSQTNSTKTQAWCLSFNSGSTAGTTSEDQGFTTNHYIRPVRRF